MSELIAEARVLVTPDTTTFRALLTTQLAAATKGVTVPVSVTPVAAGATGAVAAATKTVTKEAAAAASAVTKLAQAEKVLAAAEAKTVISSGQAANARTQFTAASRAAVLTQEAYQKALISGEDELIETAALERKLALERKNTALQTLRAAQATAATQKVQTGSAAAVAGAAAAQQSAQKITASAAAAARANALLATSANAVATAESRAAGAGTAASAAQIRHGAAVTATSTTFRAYNVALESNDLLLVKQTRDAYAAARANEALALASLDAARAEAQKSAALNRGAAAQAASLSQVSRGAGGAALSLVGLRGATLAATGPFLAGAAAFAIFAKSVSASANLETSLNVFKVTAEATGDQMERISEVARELGADLTLPGVNAQDAADALAQLSRAGLDVENSVAGVRGVLQLATAAAIDNEQAVLLTATALNSFQLAGKEATRVADLLAASSKESQGSIVDVGLSLQQSAAAANQAGVSVEDTIALLTQLGRAGLRGSDAGTSLRVAFLRLINPTKQARGELERLGVTIRDGAGNIRPEVFAEITDELNKLTKAQGDAALATIFGQDAFRAAAIIGREGTRGLNEMRDATQEQGAAAELASARTQGLAGAFENLKNQASTLGLAIGDSLKTPLTDFVNILAGGVSNINTFVGFLNRLGAEAEASGSAVEQATEEYLELIQRAGELNRAVAERDKVRVTDDFRQVTEDAGRAGERLRDKTDEVTTALEAEASAALTARDSIEDYRVSLTEAARAREAFVQAITPPEGFLPAGPPPVEPPPQVGPTTKLEGAEAVAQARGDLQEVLRIQEIQAENARKAFKNSTGNLKQREAQFAAMRAAEAKVIATRKQIAAERAAANKSAADEEKKAAAAEQQAFLARLESARLRQQNQVAIAGQTKGVADDIRENKQLGTLLQQQVKQIRASSLDEDAKRQAIEALVAATIATTGTIKGLQQAQREQREAERLEREERRQAIHDQTAENAALRTQIAETRGADKSVIVQFIDAQIVIARKALARAKAAGKGILAARLELEQFIKEKRELLKAAEEDQGTTAFDLLTQAAERFGFAGNLIGAAQPFAGPTEFTADLSQFLRRQATTTTTTTARPTTSGPFSGFVGSADRMVEALNRNTSALNGGEGGPTVRQGKKPPVSGAINRGAWVYGRWDPSRQARDTIEGAG